jgi:ABC-2 type transport system ATP-binding protein
LSDTAIQTSGLGRVFPRAGGVVQALDGLTLEVTRGTIFGLLGPNGAGKTTTVRLLLGLLAPTAGQARVLGYDVSTMGAHIRERSGALLEHDGLYERLTALDNLEYYGRIWHLPRASRSARIRELLERFQLWDRRADPVGTWSRGMKRKLALARALIHRPELVFLDEPTAGLDPGSAAALREDLSALVAQERTTIFLNTHNLAEAERLCDRIGVIAAGRLRALGSPAALRHQLQGNRVDIAGIGFRPEWRAALLGLHGVQDAEIQDRSVAVRFTNGASAAPVVRWLIEHGAEVEEVQRATASLEDVYLRATSQSPAHSLDTVS